MTGVWSTGIDCIDNDDTLQKLNDKGEELYSSLYSFDENGEACSFDQNTYVAIRDELIDIVKKIIARLEEINDGTFIVIDETSKSLSLDIFKDSLL
ncbi:MAG: hypothetical protein II992_12475 [Lachnospiraceae bacterium]|nr:hypothetical protein [Lachnospiraceae bacterium]